VLGTVTKPMTYGRLTNAVPAGPVGRLIAAPLPVTLTFDANLPASGQAALMAGEQVVDVISWRSAQLIGASNWLLKDWVRGLGGASVGPALTAGSAFILLNDALQEVAIDPALVGASVMWRARPSADASLETTRITRFDGVARQPWPPCQVKAKRTASGIELGWTRRARGTGDGWGVTNAPLGASLERYEVKIMSNSGTLSRRLVVNSPSLSYTNAQELADFGGVQNQIRVEIAQIGDDELIGRPVAILLSV
jgi:hypothetical protein